MAVLKRGAVAAPTVPKETIEVPALGGEVIVRGLLLTERLASQNQMVALRKAQADHTGDLNAIIPVLLALCVLDADSLPLWTQDQWQAFGARHPAQAVELFNAAWRLSGFDEAAQAKN